jgi:hypothetical protein
MPESPFSDPLKEDSRNDSKPGLFRHDGGQVNCSLSFEESASILGIPALTYFKKFPSPIFN